MKPLGAGKIRLTPLDDAGNPIYDESVTFDKGFIEPKQLELIPARRQQEGDYDAILHPFDEKYHTLINGSGVLANGDMNSLVIVPIYVNDNCEFSMRGMKRVEILNDKHNNVWFEVRRSETQPLWRVDSEPKNGNEYRFDSENLKLIFHDSIKFEQLTLLFVVNEIGVEEWHRPEGFGY